MNTYLVEIKEPNGRWIAIGCFNARTSKGAIAQAARDASKLPEFVAIRADIAM